MRSVLRRTAAAALTLTLLGACGGTPTPVVTTTVIGTRERAAERAAQIDLRNAVIAAKTTFLDHDTYVGFDAAAGRRVEPSLTWSDGPGAPSGENTVRIDPAGTTSSTIVINADATSGQAFCIADNAFNGGTVYGRGLAANWKDCDALPDW